MADYIISGCSIADLSENHFLQRDIKYVCFHYSPNRPILTDVSFKINAGDHIGLVGHTGSGKSTVANLITRMYDVVSGSVTIDGVNVKDYSLVNLRDGIGMVLQKNLLFAGTISDNLRWGDMEATDEEIRRAATFSAADKFVTSFKDGYETELDKGGTNLSGGQKQRLCIARALIKKPKILILDDSTSAVDTATEAQIREAFRTEIPDCTKIIIAQRISSVKDADMIVVMNDGAITGVGTHAELLDSNAEYSEIYYSQNEKEAKN